MPWLIGGVMVGVMTGKAMAAVTGLPEMLILASNHEILLSDSTRLHEKALKQGVKSTLITRDKLPHVWPTMLLLPEARRDLTLSGEFVSRVAGKTVAKAA